MKEDPISLDFRAYLKRVGLTSQELAGQLKQFSRDCRFISEHKPKYQARYPNRWVAVFDGRLIGIGKDLRKLLRRLERKGFPAGRLAVRFIYAEGEEPIFVLRAAA